MLFLVEADVIIREQGHLLRHEHWTRLVEAETMTGAIDKMKTNIEACGDNPFDYEPGVITVHRTIT